MSYIRHGRPLRFFKDTISTLYIYGMQDRIYGIGDIDEETDNENVIELVGRFINIIERESGYTNRYATYNIVRELAIRMGVEHKLKHYNEIFDEEGHWIIRINVGND